MLSHAFRRVRRRVDSAVYLQPSGNGVVDANGSTVSNLDGSSQVATPQIYHHLLGGTAVATTDPAIANDGEKFNQDPWSALNTTADHLFAYPSQLSVYATWLFDNHLAGAAYQLGSYMGLSFGEVTNYPAGLPATTATAFAIVYNFFTAHWETWVIDRFGPVGGKRFITDLGAQPQGIPVFGARYYFLEIEYFPGQRVDFYINRGSRTFGGLVQRWTDSQNGGGFTPIANTLAHETSVGLTIGGATQLATFANPNTDAQLFFEFRRRDTERPF